jgi:hypothetical protein
VLAISKDCRNKIRWRQDAAPRDWFLSFISARNRGGELKLAELSPKSREVLRLSRLDEIFETYDSEAEAVVSFQSFKSTLVGKKKPA